MPHRERFFIFFLCALSLFFLCSPSFSAERQTRTIETRYSVIHFTTDEDLAEFGRKIGGSAAYLTRDSEKTLLLAKENVDRIVYRVKSLLDMYPPQLHFSIKIYSTQAELKDIYSEMGIIGKAPIAFYAQKSHTIYLSTDRLSDGIFAHEVAHAVINSYFATPPPALMQEILAQYVDKHLKDE